MHTIRTQANGAKFLSGKLCGSNPFLETLRHNEHSRYRYIHTVGQRKEGRKDWRGVVPVGSILVRYCWMGLIYEV